jgi:hypothetical protein
MSRQYQRSRDINIEAVFQLGHSGAIPTTPILREEWDA